MGTTARSLTARGTVLQDTSRGPGIISVAGTQYPFQLEGMWRSDLPPRAGMTVEVAFSAPGQVAAITVVAESQVAKEQAQVALAAAREKGTAVMGVMVARFGGRELAALGLLAIAWFFLSAGSIDMGLGTLSFTFWEVLGVINAGALGVLSQISGQGASAGIYGFIAIAALAGPFVHHYWKDRRAHLGALLPLGLMLVVAFKLYSSVRSSMGGGNAFEGPGANQIRAEMQAQISDAISIGLGTYLALAVAGYFALAGIRRFLVARSQA